MEWGLLDWTGWNTTLPQIWDEVADKVNEQTSILGKFLFDKIVLPVGQSLLYHVEVAVQYTLNGEYEVRTKDTYICIVFSIYGLWVLI